MSSVGGLAFWKEFVLRCLFWETIDSQRFDDFGDKTEIDYWPERLDVERIQTWLLNPGTNDCVLLWWRKNTLFKRRIYHRGDDSWINVAHRINQQRQYSIKITLLIGSTTLDTSYLFDGHDAKTVDMWNISVDDITRWCRRRSCSYSIKLASEKVVKFTRGVLVSMSTSLSWWNCSSFFRAILCWDSCRTISTRKTRILPGRRHGGNWTGHATDEVIAMMGSSITPL